MNIPHGEVKHAPLKPHMSAGETRLYASLLDVATEYLEYGCGGSTILAAERPLIRSTSIDSDPNWITALRQQKLIEAAEDEGRLRLLHVDIGPVAEWGRPKDISSRQKLAGVFTETLARRRICARFHLHRRAISGGMCPRGDPTHA